MPDGVRPAGPERCDRPGHKVGLARPESLGERTGDGQPVDGCRLGLQFVAEVGEHHQRFELVVAVRPPRDDVQGEVDLGRRGLEEQRRYWVTAAVVASSPSACFLASAAFSVPSASSEAATFHWKCASSLRPTRQ